MISEKVANTDITEDSANKISQLTSELEEKNTELEDMKNQVSQLGNKLKHGNDEVGRMLIGI